MTDNLLKLKEDLKSLDNFNRRLDVAKIYSDSDSLEANPEEFFAITHKTKLIEDIIEIIDQQLKDNKSKLTSNRGGATILSGPVNSGKTHALITAYNLFRAADVTVKWLKESEIKFNRFNVLSIKDNSKSSLVSATQIKSDKIWQPIFEQLGKKDLLAHLDGIPEVEVLEDLVGEEYTTLFIDDLEKFFNQLKADNKADELQANKTFITNLLELATQDNRLSVFLASEGENKQLQDIFNGKQVLFKKTEELAEKEKFIKNYLFKNKLSKEVIRNKVSPYLELYNQAGFDFEQSEYELSKFIASYPFHPRLLFLLDKLYQDNYDQLSEKLTQLKLLANIFKNKGSKSALLLASDLDDSFLKSVAPDFNHSLNLSLKQAETKLQKAILKVVFFYTIAFNQVKLKEIFAMVARPGVDKNQFRKELKRLTVKIKYLVKKDNLYYLKPQKDLFTLINEQEVSEKEARKELLDFDYKKLFPYEIKLYGEDKISDNPELNIILFLDVPRDKDRLADFINNQLYDDYEYKNTLVPIIPKKDLFNPQLVKQTKKIIAMKKIKDKVAEQEKMNKYFNEEEKKLEKKLKESFGEYLYWVGRKNRVKLYKNEFELNNSLEFKELLEADKPLLKEYLKKIVSNKQQGIKALNLLLKLKRNKGAPFITENVFKSVIEELFIEGDIIVKQKEILKDFSHVDFYDYILCPNDFKEGSKISEYKNNNIDKQVKSRIKEDVFDILSEQETGVTIEQLINRLKEIDYYSEVDPATFVQMIEILKVNNKLISIDGKNKIYKNTSSLLKDTKNMVSDKKASQELLKFVTKDLFADQYKLYQQEEIEDSQNLEKILLLKDFARTDKLKEFLIEEVYSGLNNKDKLVVITSKKQLFVKDYLNKMKLVIGLSEMQDDINWDKKQVEFVLKRQNRVLTKSLKDNFGRAFLAQNEGDEIEIYEKEFEFKKLEDAIIELKATMGKVETIDDSKQVETSEDELESEIEEENTEELKESKQEDKVEDKKEEIVEDKQEDKVEDKKEEKEKSDETEAEDDILDMFI